MNDARPPAQRIVALIRENARLYSQLFSKRFKELSLTPEEARALTYLGAHEGGTQKRLADAMHVQPIVLSRLLDRLEAGGWIERQAYPTDKRAKILFLTAEGKVALRQIRAINNSLEQRLVLEFSTDEIEKLSENLRITQNILNSMK
jgi:MarR family transcriptional regulator for hemolysin